MISNTAGDRVYTQISDRLLDAYQKIHTSGDWIDSTFTHSVEQKLKKITGRKHAKLVTSGTTAIQIALLAWNIRNKKVACVNYSYVASANQAALLNKVEFADVDINGLMLLDQTFNHDAVIPVSLYGNTIDYDQLKIGADTKVVVDCAQSIGTKYKGKPDGSFGDVAVFSFARNKPVPTAGTHGALVWDDDTMTDKIKTVSTNGKIDRTSPITTMGINGSPFELQAAWIDIGLDHIDEWQHKRALTHDYYVGEFEHLPLQIIQPNEFCESNYHKFAMLSDERNELKNYLADNGVQALEHYTDNFANYFGSDRKFPMTDKLCKTIITLPNHAWMTDAEIETVANKVKDFYK
jgi:dTDP-4-amino-4,6-dideoxygalactose transaminase|tara:strand:+ start:4341 stop:5390 length:1050 start_codon:yes stop_codon:yes gene_type:complete